MIGCQALFSKKIDPFFEKRNRPSYIQFATKSVDTLYLCRFFSNWSVTKIFTSLHTSLRGWFLYETKNYHRKYWYRHQLTKCTIKVIRDELTIGSYVSVRSSRYEAMKHAGSLESTPASWVLSKCPKCFISRWTHSWRMNQLFCFITFSTRWKIVFLEGFVCWRHERAQ